MKKIRDIMCSYSPYDELNNGNNSFVGKVVLKEDNSFEGVVKNYRMEEIFLVFGHVEHEYMEFIQTTKFDSHLPRLYRVKRTGYKYYGDISSKTSKDETSLGECGVYFADPDIYRDVNTEGEIIGLEDTIKVLKKDLGKESQYLLTKMTKEK